MALMVRAEQVVQTALMVLRVLQLYQEQAVRQVRAAQMPQTAHREFLVKVIPQVLMVLLVHQVQAERQVQAVQMV